MVKGLSIDIEKCTGCGTCELFCSFKHHGEFIPTKSRIQVTQFWKEMIGVPVVCNQCEEPWCGKICPAGAITVQMDAASGTRVVKVSEEKCVGCRMCMLACPFGAIVVSDKGCAEKCDLCGGDPECVKFCFRGALKLIEPELSMKAKKKGVAEKLLESYKEVKC